MSAPAWDRRRRRQRVRSAWRALRRNTGRADLLTWHQLERLEPYRPRR